MMFIAGLWKHWKSETLMMSYGTHVALEDHCHGLHFYGCRPIRRIFSNRIYLSLSEEI